MAASSFAQKPFGRRHYCTAREKDRCVMASCLPVPASIAQCRAARSVAPRRPSHTLGAMPRSPSRADCPDPEVLLAAVERTAPEAERMRTINHAMTCADCGEELEL